MEAKKKCEGWGGWAGSTASTHCAQAPFFSLPHIWTVSIPPHPLPTSSPAPLLQLSSMATHCTQSPHIYFYFSSSPPHHHTSAFSTSNCSLRYLSIPISFLLGSFLFPPSLPPPSLSRSDSTPEAAESFCYVPDTFVSHRHSHISLYISSKCTRRLSPLHPPKPLFSFHTRLTSRAACSMPACHDRLCKLGSLQTK